MSTIVRYNLMNQKGYTPYCGDEICKPREYSPMKRQRWPRTEFDGSQFVCPKCNWKSAFPSEFIEDYKLKWNKD